MSIQIVGSNDSLQLPSCNSYKQYIFLGKYRVAVSVCFRHRFVLRIALLLNWLLDKGQYCYSARVWR